MLLRASLNRFLLKNSNLLPDVLSSGLSSQFASRSMLGGQRRMIELRTPITMPVFTKHGKNILFIHIPKCGGSSIIDVFRRMGYTVLLNMSSLPPQESLIASPQHLTWKELKDIVNWSEISEVFTVARNPYDRLLSEYRWATRSIDNPIELPSFDHWAMDQLSKAMADPSHADNHIRPMVDFFPSDLSCRVFRYEAGLSIISEVYAADDYIDPPPIGEFKRLSGAGSIHKSLLQREELLSSLRPSSLEAINNYYRHDFLSFLYPFQSFGGNSSDSVTDSKVSGRQDIAYKLALTDQECIITALRKLQEVRNSSQSIRKQDLEAFAEKLSDSQTIISELRSELQKGSQELQNFKSDCEDMTREVLQLKSERDSLLTEVEELRSTQMALEKVQCREHAALTQVQRTLEELEECYLLVKDRDRLLSERDQDLKKALNKLSWNREKLHQCIAFAKNQEATLQRVVNLIVRLAHEFSSLDDPANN